MIEIRKILILLLNVVFYIIIFSMEVEHEHNNVELTREVAIQRVIQRSLNVNGI